MKIQCRKILCLDCKVEGLGQIFLGKNNRISYCRIRHYVGLDPTTRKPQFKYCRVSDQSTLNNLAISLVQDSATADHIDQNTENIDQNSKNQSLNTKIQVQSLLHEGSSSSTDYDTGLRSRRSWVQIPAGPPFPPLEENPSLHQPTTKTKSSPPHHTIQT